MQINITGSKKEGPWYFKKKKSLLSGLILQVQPNETPFSEIH